MKKIFLILLGFGLLFAEVDQKDILMKEAQRFSLRRQYDKAISIYLDLQESYPEDSEIVEKLINNYLLTSQLGEAEEQLSKNKKIFKEFDYVRLNITLLLAASEIQQAEKESRKYLKNNSGKLNSYKTLATLFQRYRQYEYAIDLLLQARTIAVDEYLYTNELANNYYQSHNFNKAVEEYLKHVVKNKAYKNYVQNRIKLILKEDMQQIETIREFVALSEDDNVKEIYAVCLGEIGEISSALDVYLELDSEKLMSYALTLKKTGDQNNALLAYKKYLEVVDSPELEAEAEINIAQILWKQKKYSEMEEILQKIYSSQVLQSKNYKFKTRANRICREMLADLSLISNNQEKFVEYLEEAKQFTYNQNDKKDIELKIINYKLMDQDLDSAGNRLAKLLQKEDTASDIYKKGYYYRYLLALMQNDSLSDSLLSELLINLPDDDIVNDAIELSLLISQLSPSDRETFLHAYSSKQLFQVSEAVSSLEDLYHNTSNEQFLILAAEWALRNGDLARADTIFTSSFIDPDLSQYALLMSAQIEEADDNAKLIAEKFLTENPKSVFSPAFRKFLAEK